MKKMQELEKIQHVLGWHGGGIYKRIDEGRELLELMQKDAPEFLEKNHWVYSWIKTTDDFLTDLSQATDIPSTRFEPKESPRLFPREMPPHPHLQKK